MKEYNTFVILLVVLVICLVFSLAGYLILEICRLWFNVVPDLLSLIASEFILLCMLVAAECIVVVWECFLVLGIKFVNSLKSRVA